MLSEVGSFQDEEPTSKGRGWGLELKREKLTGGVLLKTDVKHLIRNLEISKSHFQNLWSLNSNFNINRAPDSIWHILHQRALVFPNDIHRSRGKGNESELPAPRAKLRRMWQEQREAAGGGVSLTSTPTTRELRHQMPLGVGKMLWFCIVWVAWGWVGLFFFLWRL